MEPSRAKESDEILGSMEDTLDTPRGSVVSRSSGAVARDLRGPAGCNEIPEIINTKHGSRKL